MFTLKELYDMFHSCGLSDEQIIEEYFTRNHAEDKGIELMYNLTKKRFRFYHEKLEYGKEHLSYCNAILSSNPKLTEEQKITLHRYVAKFIYFNNLYDEEIAKCAEIFETGNVQCCPLFFVLYLVKKGVHIPGNDINVDDFSDTLENVIYWRDN